jgi:hypothetical protein
MIKMQMPKRGKTKNSYSRFDFGHWRTCPVECRQLAALPRRIPQGEDFEFVSDFDIRISDL